MDKNKLSKVCSSGKMDGFIFISDFLSIIRFLQLRFPENVNEFFTFGETFEKRQMIAYELQIAPGSGLNYNFEDINDKEIENIQASFPDFITKTDVTSYLQNETEEKSRVLFTALHHSREPLTLNMILYITINLLHQIIWMNPLNMAINDDGQSTTSKLFMFGKVVFVPFVNRDSYQFINNSYSHPSFEIAKMKRKNMNNDEYSCNKPHKIERITQSGVDLNRNYDIAFDINSEGSVDDPCDQTTRGKSPFSEPETQAIKFLVENMNISAAMNFHAYGNLWITPYNYKNKSDFFDIMNFKFATFYTLLSDKLHQDGFRYVGNAASTIKYTANGEASDWMLKSKGIIAMSPELGSDEKITQDFYISKKGIRLSLVTDYLAVQEFMKQTEPLFEFVEGGWVIPIQNDDGQGEEDEGYFTKFIDSVKKIFSHELVENNKELVERHLSFFIETYSDVDKKNSSHLHHKSKKKIIKQKNKNKKSDENNQVPKSESEIKNKLPEIKNEQSGENNQISNSESDESNINIFVPSNETPNQSEYNIPMQENIAQAHSQELNQPIIPLNNPSFRNNQIDHSLIQNLFKPQSETQNPNKQIEDINKLLEQIKNQNANETIMKNNQFRESTAESINPSLNQRILLEKSQEEKDKQKFLKEYKYESISLSNIDEMIKDTKAEIMKNNFEEFLKKIKKNNLVMIFENKSIIDLFNVDIALKLGTLGNLNKNLIKTSLTIFTENKGDDNVSMGESKLFLYI